MSGHEGIRVGIIMGSHSDLPTMKKTGEALRALGLEQGIDYEERVMSIHRTPARAIEYAHRAKDDGLQIIIAGAGGSAHLPGMVASETMLPVLGVSVTKSPDTLNRALSSMIGMPEGKPLATFQAEAGAFNAGLFAARILAINDSELEAAYGRYERQLEAAVIENDGLLKELGADGFMHRAAQGGEA